MSTINLDVIAYNQPADMNCVGPKKSCKSNPYLGPKNMYLMTREEFEKELARIAAPNRRRRREPVE